MNKKSECKHNYMNPPLWDGKNIIKFCGTCGHMKTIPISEMARNFFNLKRKTE